MTSKARKLANVLADNQLNAQDVTGVQAALDAQSAAIQSQIDALNTSLQQQLAAQNASIQGQISSQNASVTAQLNSQNTSVSTTLSAKADKSYVDAEVSKLKSKIVFFGS